MILPSIILTLVFQYNLAALRCFFSFEYRIDLLITSIFFLLHLGYMLYCYLFDLVIVL